MIVVRVPPREWQSEPKSERMRAVLAAVKTLPQATSATVAEHCGITVAQACYCLNVWGRFKRIRVVAREKNAGVHKVIVWGLA